MEKSTLRRYNTQLSRIYAFQLLYFIISGSGLLLNHLHLQNDYLFWSIMILNVCAIYFFQPWKISAYLNEGYGYQEGLKLISATQRKNEKFT